jgi:hypothetical protein
MPTKVDRSAAIAKTPAAGASAKFTQVTPGRAAPIK